jgi:regulation of enolase protein 1 (concanavalin A-like superfamily)
VLNGNGEVRARVRSFTNTNPWAKAGVMVRETLAAGSRHVMMFITPPDAGNGFGMVSRLTANGTTGYAGGPAMNTSPNNWVRLVREGNVLTGYASANGSTWVLVSSTTLTNLPAQVYVGLAATAADSGVTTTAELDNVQVIGVQTVVTPSVTLSTASGVETGPFTVQVQFSQAVTGLTLADFAVTNATASNLTGSGAAYSVTLTPSAAGVVTASLPAGAAHNAAATGSTASNLVSVTYTVPATVVLLGQDVGAPIVAGSTTLSSGVYTLKGSGSDIYGTADGFHQALTQLTGDGEIRARVTSQSNTNPWSKTGVMMREALTAGARHAMAFTTPAGENNGFGMVWRPTANAATNYAGGPAINAVPNNWVRLVRSGATISAYASANGNAWTLMSTATLTGLSNTVYVGLAVTSSSPAVLATSTFDNVQVVGAQVVVAPVVTLSAASSIEAGPFTVQAQFSQTVTGLALNDFLVTNATASNLTGSGTSYNVTLTPAATGVVTVQLPANAAQNAGAVGSTASNTLNVSYTPPVMIALQGQDVGIVQIAGSTAYDSTTDTYTLRGAGEDIFFAADGFHYASTQITGNGEIRARITSQSNTHPWAKTGVMIREALTAGARHAVAFTTPVAENNGFGMVSRSTVNAAASYAGGPAVNTAPNNWVRIVRTGDTLTSYASANGSAWTLIDSTTLTGLSNVVRIGLAVTSSSPFDLAVSTFDNVQIIQAVSAPAAAAIVKNVLGSSTTAVETTSLQSASAQPVADADIDGDGVNDLIEYALGSDNSFDGGWWLATTRDGRVDAHLNHPRGITGVSFILESSTDLSTWRSLMLAPTPSPLSSDMEQLTWSGITSVSGQDKQRGILRLRVTHRGGASAVTTAQAWQRYTFTAGSQTAGVTLVNAPLYAGRIEQLSGSSAVILANAQAINAHAGSPCYLEVLDGAQAGHRFEISSLTAGVATLVFTSPLSTLQTLPGDLIGARVVVRPHVTLGQAFPVDVFQAGAVAEAADQVLFYESGAWHPHWLSARSGLRQWVSLNDAAQFSQNAKIIPPGVGLMVKAATQPKSFTLTGHVRMSSWRKALNEGQNLLAMPWPLDATPQQLGLTSESGFTASTSMTSADQLQFWQGDRVPGATTYDTLWLLKRAPRAYWTAKGSASLTNVSATLLLPAHRAFFLKVQPPTATCGWVLP